MKREAVVSSFKLLLTCLSAGPKRDYEKLTQDYRFRQKCYHLSRLTETNLVVFKTVDTNKIIYILHAVFR